jgi:hypothetical protein
MVVFRPKMIGTANLINQIGMVESSPEKAGVGGSIPSLATIFSITYELNSDLKPHRR